MRDMLCALTVTEAAQLLAAGQLVAFPTETVYGLGADANQDAAVAMIFSTKGRPADHPLIVHVADVAAALHYAQHLPDFALRLAHAFWPGPLTLILPRHSAVAAACAGGQDSIGLRSPAHPLARDLLAQCAKLGVTGLAAPSANRFGKVSPTTAAHVMEEFGAAVPVLDGGPCEVGIESSIIDCTRGMPVLLRPGVLTKAAIEAVLGQTLHVPSQDGSTPRVSETTDSAALGPVPRVSGSLASHYAPLARIELMSTPALVSAVEALRGSAPRLAIYARTSLGPRSAHAAVLRMPHDAVSAARELFSALRALDAQGIEVIWVEEVPCSQEWDGVRDRLQRAAA